MTDLFAGLSLAGSSSPSKQSNNQNATPTGGVPPMSASPTKTASAPVPSPAVTSTPATTMTAAASSGGGGAPMRSAPATDKLLGLLGESPAAASAAPPAPSGPLRAASSPAPPAVGFTPAKPASPPKKRAPKTKVPGSSSSAATDPQPNNATTTTTPPPLIASKSAPSPAQTEETAEVLQAFSRDSNGAESSSKQSTSSSNVKSGKPPKIGGDPAAVAPTRRGKGIVHMDTPIPHGDVALRLFRKFASKTQSMVPVSHGGTKRLSILGYIFGPSSDFDTKYDAYRDLMEVIGKTAESSENEEEENDKVVNAILGESGDTADKAKEAVASFCNLLTTWGHASAHMVEAEKGSSQYPFFCDILAIGWDTATALVMHGCLDGVRIGIGAEKNEYHKAVDFLAESVFASDLSKPKNELAAMKFLLSTGCRVTADSHQAMLRGTHLLQTIRVLYHVYLTTTTQSNKTTARASLQQLVSSVFIRMITAASSTSFSEQEEDDDNDNSLSAPSDSGAFPTENHRDAFLVLRSLCKLSMRSPPSHMHSHIGLQAGGSNTNWDGASPNDASSKNPTSPTSAAGIESGQNGTMQKVEQPHLVYTQAIHPALESKILALDLMLYVLQNTDMKGSFLQKCGSQFHYAIRNYLCVSLLKNCTSDDTRVVNLSLRVFVPIIANFRSILKAEIEAFVTNVFFVILDSKNSPIEHKLLVVTLFEEICSDPTTLAEIFLNYDCDLSAVDLFHRIVNTLSRVARSSEMDQVEQNSSASTISLVAGSAAARMEKLRNEHRELRLEAMKALRQVLASLHASIVTPMIAEIKDNDELQSSERGEKAAAKEPATKTKGSKAADKDEKKSLVQIYDSKKKRREEESEIVLRFNQKPSAGISYAAKCGHLDATDPADVARYLLENKDKLDKTQIGEYLGREPEYQNGFSMRVLHAYVNGMDFLSLSFDDAIRFYLSGFRLPGEAQKIDRIMEKFAERYTAQNPEVFPTADVAFILAFSIIMLNTDLHNPAIKEDRRMTKDGFIRNNRGICDGQDLPQDLLLDIFDRIKANPISLKEDDEAREKRAGDPSGASNSATSLPSALSPAAFFTSPYDEMDRTKETNFNKERDQIVRTTESLLRRRRQAAYEQKKEHKRTRSNNPTAPKAHHVKYVRTKDSGLRDEYVSPMFEVTWGPALAAFSTAMESANGTVGALLAIATDEELEIAAVNAAETIEVCLTGFRFAICTAGLCGNDVARDAFMLALTRFTQLGTGIILEPRHVRCIQTLLDLARSDGELLGSSWEHVFRSLSEVNRYHQLFQLMARNDRAVAHAAQRRRARVQEREERQRQRQKRKKAKENSDSLDDASVGSTDDASVGDLSYPDSDLFSDDDSFDYNEDDMDNKEIDEANARTVFEAVSEVLIEAIYERSSSLSTGAVKEFILQLCRVSRMEISNYGGHAGSESNQVDLGPVHYRQHHGLLSSNSGDLDLDGFHHHQTNIYNLQKLVEVTHYNMDSRPRLVFADLWVTVAAHLTSTALHSNPAVAMYAVDSFRQLSIQYLQRGELGVFEFQKRFLKPLETVMARSEVSTTKELLLKCVERLILMFGSSDEDGKKGMLRSGWRPVLTVLGLAGRDKDEEIAKLGFSMLAAQLVECLSRDNKNVLLAERFVDLVDALLIYLGGPHEDMSKKSLDHLVTLSDFLDDDAFALPLVRKRPATSFDEDGGDEDKDSNKELELWWPILLGISKAIGDDRPSVRSKSLDVLMKIIAKHFFPAPEESATKDNDKKASQLQTLQLVFRGILAPVLEFAEVNALDSRAPDLPEGFDRFITAPKVEEKEDSPPNNTSYWLDEMFDQFMDGCISLCRKSINSFDDDTLVDEIFAMLNTCLLSDSGALAVRGLRRLDQLVSSDLDRKTVTDDTWATVSHMLRRSLTLRAFPKAPSPPDVNGSVKSAQNDDGSDEEPNPALREKEAIREFVMEDNMLADRRYIGSNAVSVIASFLGSDQFSKTLGIRWRLFLVSGLGKSISEWEQAAALLLEHGGKPRGHNPPHYLETACYGRRYMNRFLLQIANKKDTAEASSAQTLMKEQTESLITAFLEKEAAVTAGSSTRPALDSLLFQRLTGLVKDMLTGYSKLSDEQIMMMSWLNPVLSSCITTDNESIRVAIQKLVKRLHEEANAKPSA